MYFILTFSEKMAKNKVKTDLCDTLYTYSFLRISIPGTVDIELYGTEHLLDKSLICDWTRFKCVVSTVTVVEIWRPALF